MVLQRLARVRSIAVAFLSAATVAGCIGGGPGNLGVAWIRNESTSPVRVAIDQPSHAFLGGTDHQTFLIPPWHKGWCPAFGYGIDEGAVTINVSRSSVPFPTQTTINVPIGAAPTSVMVLVDANGEVHFSTGEPAQQKGSCQGYPPGFSDPGREPSRVRILSGGLDHAARPAVTSSSSS